MGPIRGMAASRNYSGEGYAFSSGTANQDQLNDDCDRAQPEPTSNSPSGAGQRSYLCRFLLAQGAGRTTNANVCPTPPTHSQPGRRVLFEGPGRREAAGHWRPDNDSVYSIAVPITSGVWTVTSATTFGSSPASCAAF